MTGVISSSSKFGRVRREISPTEMADPTSAQKRQATIIRKVLLSLIGNKEKFKVV